MPKSAELKLERAWRIIATGLSFAAFGIGGVVLWAIIFPLLQLSIKNPKHRQRLARRWVQRAFTWHIEWMRRSGVLNYQIDGAERLNRPGLLILANHPTLIDVVFLISQLPNADCIIKPAVARNFYMRGPVRAAGYVSCDDGPGLVDSCIASVRAGGSLVIFPEGTRTEPGRPIKLQRGAANIAIRGRLNITPVRITCMPATLTKGLKWYSVPDRRFTIKLHVGEDIAIDPFLPASGDESGSGLAARRLNDYLHNYFANDKDNLNARA